MFPALVNEVEIVEMCSTHDYEKIDQRNAALFEDIKTLSHVC